MKYYSMCFKVTYMVSNCVYPLPSCIFTIMFWTYSINLSCFMKICHIYFLVFHYINIAQCIHFPVDGYLIQSQILVITNNNIYIHCSLNIYVYVKVKLLKTDSLELLYFAKLLSKYLQSSMSKNLYFKFFTTLCITQVFIAIHISENLYFVTALIFTFLISNGIEIFFFMFSWLFSFFYKSPLYTPFPLFHLTLCLLLLTYVFFQAS